MTIQEAALHFLGLALEVAAFVTLLLLILLTGMYIGMRRERRAREATYKHNAAYVAGSRSTNAIAPPIARRASLWKGQPPPKLWRKL